MLQLDGVSAAISGAQVLRAVSLEVGIGARVALVGRNGAGKTSTLRAIMGRLLLTGGVVRLEVLLLQADEVARRRSVVRAILTSARAGRRAFPAGRERWSRWDARS